MEDLFEREQNILNHALLHLEAVQQGSPCRAEEFAALVKEYSRVLKQLRRITKISDKTAVELNTSKLDLMEQVQYDPMTGIYNRRFLESNLPQVVEALAKENGYLSVLMLDVDFFKKFNDTYGHSMGDVCLQAVAQTLHSCIPEGKGFAARYGGEEFTIVLPGATEETARAIAEQILKEIRARSIPHEHNTSTGCVTISIGVTTGVVQSKQCGKLYLQTADKALYLSKQNGRNRFTFIELREA